MAKGNVDRRYLKKSDPKLIANCEKKQYIVKNLNIIIETPGNQILSKRGPI